MMIVWICVAALALTVILLALSVGKLDAELAELKAVFHNREQAHKKLTEWACGAETRITSLEKAVWALKLESIRTERWKENHMKELREIHINAEDMPADDLGDLFDRMGQMQADSLKDQT